MSDLISRQAVIDLIMENDPFWCEGMTRTIFDGIDRLPSVDAVPVVRCKDCRWGRKVCGNIECCCDMNVPPEYHGFDWFCPNGEREKKNERIHNSI